MKFPRKEKYGAIMAELPYIMAIFLSAAINNFHIFMAIYGYGHYGVPIPEIYALFLLKRMRFLYTFTYFAVYLQPS